MKTRSLKTRQARRATLLLVAMAAMLALPTMASAQESRSNFGGLFGTNPIGDLFGTDPTAETANEEEGMFGGNRGGGLSNQTFGENSGGSATETDVAPLGSGLLIMVAAGAGYALLKKKED